jgi:hypothetical protein
VPKTRLVSAAIVAMLIAGCSSDMDTPTPMTIVNRTAGPVDVVLHETLSSGADSPTPIMTLPSGETRTLSGPFGGGGPCLRGDLVATQNGRTVATLEKPCEGSRWEISSAAASPAA